VISIARAPKSVVEAPLSPSQLPRTQTPMLPYEPTPGELRPHVLFEVQHWRERSDGYLNGTSFGYAPERPPLSQEDFRSLPSSTYHAVVGAMAGGLAGERIALECSAALCAHAPDDNARMFLATQVIDEARHVEVFSHRLRLLGKEDLDATMRQYVNPKMFVFHDKMRARVIESRDFVGGVVGQNLALEGLALGFFEFNAQLLADVDPGTSAILRTVLLDERRHVGFGLMRMRQLLEHQPDRRSYVEETMTELAGDMLEILEENAENMGSLGVDPQPAMDKVRAYHQMHLGKLGMSA
jgi:ribonucleotide reductase beta subunit family protein with ferritin-like domain